MADEYIYLKRPSNFPDSCEVVSKPEKVTLNALIGMKERTHGRFNYTFEPNSNAKIVNVSFVNYVKDGESRLKIGTGENNFLQCQITDRVNEQWVIEE